MLPRPDLVYKTSAWLLCRAGAKWWKPEVMLPMRLRRTICFRDSPGALVRFSFHEIGESPRCCPVLCGLRDRCIAAMLATRKRRDTKAELNRRSQACEVLADTGIRVARNGRASG